MLGPPIEPMLAKVAEEIPAGAGFLYEPKWDGFRAIVFRDAGGVFIQSRDLRPFDRYFPDLHDVFLKVLPPGCVVDGEIVIATEHGLDFDALQMRLHPAASRVAMLANQQPASFVAFDLLAVDGEDITQAPQQRAASTTRKASWRARRRPCISRRRRVIARRPWTGWSDSKARDWTASSRSRRPRRTNPASA